MPALSILELERGEARRSVAFDDTTSQSHVDVRGHLNLTHEVIGHAGLERRAAHDQRDMAGELREVEGRLPRRVGTTDDADPFPRESGALGRGGPVEKSRSGPPLERWDTESPVLDP